LESGEIKVKRWGRAMISPLIIKEVTDEFEQKARALILEGFLERFGFIDERFNPDLNEIISHYSQEKRVFLIGLQDGELIGTGALIEENETTGRIVRMSVANAYRRNGFAGQILRQLEQQAQSKDYRNLVLETNKDWESAIAFYLKMGYQVVAVDEEQIHLSKQI
jgi:N-acetylglutamate synthase-like GNAT family acetyltransferase